VVSGYAKGVDTASHLAALDAGGTTIAVLAEGLDHFRLKKAYRELLSADSVERKMLILSQFPPAQRWSAGAAMTRNQVIVGLSQALVVVEAGETGGTLKAGETALRGKRRVLVLGGPNGAPRGNEQLIAAGARQVLNRVELVDELRRSQAEEASVLPLD
jgi:DNA processing protein